ncbi:MAG: hypothetical protein AB7J13_02155 [Pyrinomonadaceae bacterium]
MIVSIFLLIAMTLGGAALTYLVARERTLMWRLAAGNIIGSAIFGLTAFVIACLFGFSPITVGFALAITLAPLLLWRRKDLRKIAEHDWARAKGKLQGGSSVKFLRFVYYAFFFIVFWYFFGYAIYEMSDGLYTGGSQNLGDLPFHLGAIFSFTEANNFPPINPSWAGSKFSYPFIADLLTANFMMLGGELKAAIFLQDLSWAFSLFILLESFVARITGSKLAGRIAPALLFFSGGLGFVWALRDISQSAKGLGDFLWHLPLDYTIGNFRWGNAMVVLFMTQRSLLLGMPLAILVLAYLWRVFTCEPKADEAAAQPASNEKKRKAAKAEAVPAGFFDPVNFRYSALFAGLLAGTLPLIHLHSLAVLFVVTAFLFAFQPGKWKTWITFGAGVSLIAVPILAWSIVGSATETSKFFDWHWGWDKQPEDGIVWFWFKNTGILIPMITLGIWIYLRQPPKPEEGKKEGLAIGDLLLFYIPFVVLFVISNVAKLAPWQWDNIKVLIYWFLLSIPFVAMALAWMWQKNTALRVVAVVCFVMLTSAGALDVFRTASGQVKIRVFDSDAMKVADQIKAKTDPKALFLNAPTYNSAVVLSGRQSLMRYTGHLSSHGINIGTREQDVRQIYQGGAVTDVLLKKYDIDYVLISPEEKNALKANEEFFKKYPIAAQSGDYKVYKVK